LRQDERLSRDLEGEPFDDLQHALQEAASWARELAGAAVTNDEAVRGHVEIADDDGQILATVMLRNAVRF
jgi:hypothetical protein